MSPLKQNNSPSFEPERDPRDTRVDLNALKKMQEDELRAHIVRMQHQMDTMQRQMNAQEMALQGRGLSRLAVSQPYMPTMRNGVVQYPMLQNDPSMQNPDAQRFLNDMTQSSMTVDRFRQRSAQVARRNAQRYGYAPYRQEREKPRPKPGAIRTRYVRGRGLFEQEYTVTGPDNGWEDRGTLKSYADVKAKGEANFQRREAEIAAEEQRYIAAGKVLKRWNEGGRDSDPFIREENFAKYAGNDIDGNPIKPGYHGPTGTDIAHATHIDDAVERGAIPLHSGDEGNFVYLDRPDMPRPTAGGKDRASDYRAYMGIPEPESQAKMNAERVASDRERANDLYNGLTDAIDGMQRQFDAPKTERESLEAATGNRLERKQQDPNIAWEAADLIGQTLKNFEALKNVMKPTEFQKRRTLMIERRQKWLEEWEQKSLQTVVRALREGREDEAKSVIKKIEDAFSTVHGKKVDPLKAFMDNNAQQLNRRDMPYVLAVDPAQSRNGRLKIVYTANKKIDPKNNGEKTTDKKMKSDDKGMSGRKGPVA